MFGKISLKIGSVKRLAMLSCFSYVKKIQTILSEMFSICTNNHLRSSIVRINTDSHLLTLCLHMKGRISTGTYFWKWQMSITASSSTSQGNHLIEDLEDGQCFKRWKNDLSIVSHCIEEFLEQNHKERIDQARITMC